MKPLHHGSGCFIPITVATCPECGGELYAMTINWEEATGRPFASAIGVYCRDDNDLKHNLSQGEWKPVLDKIAAWCGAINQ